MKIGIFVNKDHQNYIPYIAFLTSQIAEYNNIFIHSYNNVSIFSDYNLYEKNVFLNRYCLLNIKTIQKLANKNFILGIDCDIHIPICILTKNTINKIGKNTRIFSYLSKPYKFSYLTLDKSVFDCYNDLDDSYIKFLKEYFYKNKPVFFKGKVYYIDPKTQLKNFKNTHLAILNKNLQVIWDSKKQQWIKLTSKEHIKC